jgi:hypothetical protein
MVWLVSAELANQALQFLCMPGQLQVAACRSAQERGGIPEQFADAVGQESGADFFVGMGMVFIENRVLLAETTQDVRALDAIDQLNHRLDVMMCGQDAADFSAEAVLASGTWEKLRAEANEARVALALPMAAQAPVIDLDEIVDAHFGVSDEARKILDNL